MLILGGKAPVILMMGPCQRVEGIRAVFLARRAPGRDV